MSDSSQDTPATEGRAAVPGSGCMVGGRFDGLAFPPGYCAEVGEIVAVNHPGGGEDVYIFDGKNLVFDADATQKRAVIFARDGEWGQRLN